MQSFKVVHIAGTNGKGSVATKIASALQLAGHKVGLFTSPHIHSPTERIRINGVPIADVHFTDFASITKAALQTFEDKKVDWAVIEVGLGGRLDPTNCVCPDVSVITSIALDHSDVLGETLEEIAYEKAGILRPNIPCVLGGGVPPGLITHDPLFQAAPHINYDNENIATARLVCEVIGIAPLGLEVLPPGRMEWINEGTVIDAAHNPAALEKLFASLPRKDYAVLFALSPSKDLAGCLDVLKKHARTIGLPVVEGCRSPREISAALGKFPHTFGVPTRPLVVCGSFRLAAKCIDLLKSP